MVKEFLLQDEHFYKFTLVNEIGDSLAFFYKNGEEVFRSKALFSKIFAHEGLEVFHHKISKLLKLYIASFNKTNGINDTNFNKINMKEFFDPLMASIANCIIMGHDGIDVSPEAKELNALFTQMCDISFQVFTNPLFMLLPGISRKFGLIKGLRTIEACRERQIVIMQKLISERESQDKLGECILDRIITHNRKCKESGNVKDIMSTTEVAGIYNIFFFAGTDTSMQASINAICFMANKNNLKQNIEDINKEIFDENGLTCSEAVEKHERLELWVKEVLRLHAPLQRQLIRTAMKDVTLGNVTVKKGDSAILLFSALNQDGTVYDKPEEFQIDRFAKENDRTRPRYQYVPFSIGRRICMGRHLGELMIKLLVTQFCLSYEFERPSGVEYYNNNRLTNCIENPLLNLKSKV